MRSRDELSGASVMQVQPSDAQVAAAVAAFRLLADGTRLRLLWVLAGDAEHPGQEHDVTGLAELVGASRALTSQHLAKLRLAGLIEARREGRRVVHRLRGAHVRALIAEALFHADHQISRTPAHD
jgi:DNA-binding transcriptional ArsR family regulator